MGKFRFRAEQVSCGWVVSIERRHSLNCGRRDFCWVSVDGELFQFTSKIEGILDDVVEGREVSVSVIEVCGFELDLSVVDWGSDGCRCSVRGRVVSVPEKYRVEGVAGV